ncbi:hypothetical protein CL616_00475 [archaeon]|nr:hypothetical protein [archaeon]
MKKVLFITYGGTHYKILNLLNDNFDMNVLMHSKFKEDWVKNHEYLEKKNIEYFDSIWKLFVNSWRNESDLVLAHCPLSGAISYFTILFSKKKRVFLMCQDFYEYFDVTESKWYRRVFLGRLIKWFIKLGCKSDLVIALSTHIRKRAIHYGAKRVKIIPIYGVDMDIFFPKKSKIKFDTDKKILLSTARFSGEKGLDNLIEAVRDLDLYLVMVGMGDSKFVEDLVKKYGMEDKVNVVGGVNPVDIADYYNACDIFVLPSLKEGLGFASAEAMACKKAVVASETGGIPDIVIHNKTGLLVKPGDVEELRNALKRVLEDEVLSKRLADEGFKHVEENFQEKEIRKDFVKTLNEVTFYVI